MILKIINAVPRMVIQMKVHTSQDSAQIYRLFAKLVLKRAVAERCRNNVRHMDEQLRATNTRANIDPTLKINNTHACQD